MEQNKKQNIVLTGFMGSGKTSVGIRLSYRLKRMFLDTDKEIERRQGKTVSDIFAQDGEAAFRHIETEYLQELLKENGSRIVSTGGGMPVREENRRLLKKLGTVIYLQALPETLYDRLREDTARPLLQNGDAKVTIKGLLAERQAFYESGADVIIQTDYKSIDEIVEEITAGLKLEAEWR